MRDQEIISQIKLLKSEHPFWGYRRIWANLNNKLGVNYNKKRIYRIMKANNLLLSKDNNNKALRTKKSKPIAMSPNSWWGIDMTKIKLHYIGWVYITVIIDWYSKKILGYHIGLQSKSIDWQAALDMAIHRQYPFGIKRYQHNLCIMSDNGCQPTSRSFKDNCKLLGINLVFTSYCNPKGNAETERFIRTMKEECLWINEFESFDELKQILTNWIENYNQQYLHSSLKYKTPNQFEEEYFNKNPLQFIENKNQKYQQKWDIELPTRRAI